MKKQIDITTLGLTPKDLADLFWAMDDAEQGLFFDELGQTAMLTKCPFSKEIGSMFPLDWQMYHAGKKATSLGRDAMARISQNGVILLVPQHDRPYENLPTP